MKLAEFRRLNQKGEDDPETLLEENYRPTMPVYNRPIRTNINFFNPVSILAKYILESTCSYHTIVIVPWFHHIYFYVKQRSMFYDGTSAILTIINDDVVVLHICIS